MAAPNFWDDQKAAQAVISEANALKDLVEEFSSLEERFDNLEVTYELLKEEPDDELQAELVEEAKKLMKDFSEFELQLLLNEPYDQNNAILELHPGRGRHGIARLGVDAVAHVHALGGEKTGLKSRRSITSRARKPGLKRVTLLIKRAQRLRLLKTEKRGASAGSHFAV